MVDNVMKVTLVVLRLPPPDVDGTLCHLYHM